MGVSQDWTSHAIGHELTALHGISHGQTLAGVLPAVRREMKEQKMSKLLQYGERIWGLVDGTPAERAEWAIEHTEKFFRSLGLATRLCELNVAEETIAEIERRFTMRGKLLGEGLNIDGRRVAKILLTCAK
jgi:NADP-dependent alcohol dehydrogenase